MKRISLSTGTPQHRFGDRKTLRLLAESGFDGADFLLHGHEKLMLPEDEFAQYFTDLRALADALGITICQTHGLLAGFGPDDQQNALTLETAKRQLKATALLGAKHCVLHSARAYQWGFDAPFEQVQIANRRMCAALIPTAEACGVSLCLESLGRTKVNGVIGLEFYADPNRLMADYDALPTDRKGLCLDTDHCWCAMDGGHPDPAETVRLFGSRLTALHLSDSGGSGKHPRPGLGKIDWAALLAALDEVGYSGFYNFELSLRQDDGLEAEIRELGSDLREFVNQFGA